ncbi:MAG: hypothetical protein ABI970_14545 [Chloroflexota bacterium]
MSEEMSIWRQALKDEKHPLNRAAWILFGKNFDVEYAEKKLEAQKEDAIGFCMLLLDSPELYPDSALGSGKAPANAVELLCRWQVEAAIPRLLKILDDEDWDALVYGTTADSIAAYGAILVEPLLESAARNPGEEKQAAIAGTLADAAPGDPRTVAFIRKQFDSSTKDFQIRYMAENVLAGDPEGGIKWLEGKLRTQKFSKDIRKRIEDSIADAKAGRFKI